MANRSDQWLAFPVNVFNMAKKRSPRDIKRNRVSVWIDDDPYVFSRKEWQQAKRRTAYQIIRKIEGGTVISSIDDFVIMPHADFDNARVLNDKTFMNLNGKSYVDIFLENVLYVFTNDQWANGDIIAREQQLSYEETLELIRIQIYEAKISCKRYIKRKQYRRK